MQGALVVYSLNKRLCVERKIMIRQISYIMPSDNTRLWSFHYPTAITRCSCSASLLSGMQVVLTGWCHRSCTCATISQSWQTRDGQRDVLIDTTSKLPARWDPHTGPGNPQSWTRIPQSWTGIPQSWELTSLYHITIVYHTHTDAHTSFRPLFIECVFYLLFQDQLSQRHCATSHITQKCSYAQKVIKLG